MSLSDKITKIMHCFQRSDKNSAKLAKDRLQIIIAHERAEQHEPDYIALLQKELLEVITKYVQVNQEDVKIELAQKENCSILELNVVLPNR